MVFTYPNKNKTKDTFCALLCLDQFVLKKITIEIFEGFQIFYRISFEPIMKLLTPMECSGNFERIHYEKKRFIRYMFGLQKVYLSYDSEF